MMADLSSSHSFSMSLNASGSCLNLDDILDANCFLTSLSFKASYLIRQVTGILLNYLIGQGFENCKKHTTSRRSVDNSASRFNRASNLSENKSNKTAQKSFEHFWSILGWYTVHSCEPLCSGKNIYDAEYFATTTELQ